ncbi:hypothetical protein [Jeotgalibacillus campisalis]|uniref:Lipoprotein n=1 Tax=Jeotgalibacillus campisalis TaxID=220754 RepID=A0A0C2VHN1_9BACL|nr:hypothetical protein [Jeotgalibacillus campisalis]KIL48382.1 hypothetical protein KR50_14180 [Jeotgalibacillus campisalis]
MVKKPVKMAAVFSVISLCLAGCADLYQPSPTHVSIDWVDLVNWEGTEYAYDEELSKKCYKSSLDQELGEIRFTVEGSEEETNPEYRVKEGEATYAPIGSKVFSIEGEPVADVICVNGKGYERW